MDRETLEIVAGSVAAILFAISEMLALSKKSNCNSVSQLLANAAQCIRAKTEQEEPDDEAPVLESV